MWRGVWGPQVPGKVLRPWQGSSTWFKSISILVISKWEKNWISMNGQIAYQQYVLMRKIGTSRMIYESSNHCYLLAYFGHLAQSNVASFSSSKINISSKFPYSSNEPTYLYMNKIQEMTWYHRHKFSALCKASAHWYFGLLTTQPFAISWMRQVHWITFKCVLLWVYQTHFPALWQ